VELVDALRSGRSGGNLVGAQIPPPAGEFYFQQYLQVKLLSHFVIYYIDLIKMVNRNCPRY